MVGNRDGLITALEHGNVEVLKAFRKALGDVLLPTADIETWLEEVVKELKAPGCCNFYGYLLGRIYVRIGHTEKGS